MIDTNLTGVFNVSCEASPLLADGGRIVNIVEDYRTGTKDEE